MRHTGKITGLIIALVTVSTPLLVSGHVLAYSDITTHEITVTAIVPSHRDIILDKQGKITEIDSNTKEDVSPDVYSLKYAPENQRPLSADMLAQYRKYVPAGTAKYGVLYKRPASASILSVSNQPLTSPFLVVGRFY